MERSDHIQGYTQTEGYTLKTIALLAVLAVWLLQLSGSLKSSVGGPMTIMLVMFIAMLAVGIYEAWLQKRGPVGWIVNIIVSVFAGFLAAIMAGTLMDLIMPFIGRVVKIEGSLVSSNHPLFYILFAAMTVLIVYGSWLSLRLVNRFR